MRFRLVGLCSCLVAMVAGLLLFRSVGAAPHQDPTVWQVLLALATIVPASLGAALLFMGRGLFEPLPPPVGRCRCAACAEARARAERATIAGRSPGARTGSSGFP